MHQQRLLNDLFVVQGASAVSIDFAAVITAAVFHVHCFYTVSAVCGFFCVQC